MGLSLSFLRQALAAFGWYLSVLGFFHFSEYFSTSIYNYSSLSVDSFLLNHSVAYAVAAVCSWCEFFLEMYFFPGPVAVSKMVVSVQLMNQNKGSIDRGTLE